jgi:hypothetical protein
MLTVILFLLYIFLLVIATMYLGLSSIKVEIVTRMNPKITVLLLPLLINVNPS